MKTEETHHSLVAHITPGLPKLQAGNWNPTILYWMEMVISHHFLCRDWVHHPIEPNKKWDV